MLVFSLEYRAPNPCYLSAFVTQDSELMSSCVPILWLFLELSKGHFWSLKELISFRATKARTFFFLCGKDLIQLNKHAVKSKMVKQQRSRLHGVCSQGACHFTVNTRFAPGYK